MAPLNNGINILTPKGEWGTSSTLGNPLQDILLGEKNTVVQKKKERREEEMKEERMR